MEAALTMAGHRFVGARIRSRYSQADWAAEIMGGVSQLFFLRDLLQEIESNWDGVQATLEAIRGTLLRQSNALCNITLDHASWKTVHDQAMDFLNQLPGGEQPAEEWRPGQLPGVEGLTAPAQINFVGKGTNLYAAGYQFHGSAFVINPYLRGTYMWDKIRVQGGAYGGFTQFDHHSGAFTFLSYRDPNLDQSLAAYDRAAEYLRSLKLREEELTKAIIGAIGELDAYQLPDAKGFTSMVRYILGITDAERQRIRDEVLATGEADFHAFGEALQSAMSIESAVVVLGSAEAVQSSQLNQSGQMEIKKLL